jgi:class 3 adenylate cyclase
MSTCAQCGQDNHRELGSANACGAELAERGSSREMRKTVTVLFCDVTGSTALGESLDPEAADRGQSPGDRGGTRLVLASVLRAGGREDEALASAQEALRLFEGKGIAGYAERARAFVAASTTPGG